MPRASGAHAVRLIDELRRTLEDFDPRGQREVLLARRRTLRLLELETPALDRRHYQPGHVTASGIVLSPDGQEVLLVYHRRVGRWLQPGGHVESSDRSIVASARREVFEETGVVTRQDAVPRMVGLSVHQIPRSGREPAHLHHDIVWRFVAANTRLGANGERQRAVWCRVDELDRYDADGPLRLSLKRALG
jgi:8-oxo-dGTP pyrophosphatase MutT (NUDIX family)